jgi:hypothetical protein
MDIKLKPKYQYELLRIGNKNDGGYLVEKSSFQNSDFLIGLGINDDWSFEKNFKKDFIGVDNQLSFKFLLKNFLISFFLIFSRAAIFNPLYSFLKIIDYLSIRNKFIQATVSNYDNSDLGFISLKTIFTKIIKNPIKGKVFLKSDIEGSEYRILNDILKYEDFLSGLVIEFHDVDLNKDKIIDFSNKLNLELVHIHANNFGGVDSKNNPLVIEISYSRNPKKIGNFPKLPNVLDRPNDTKRREINLNFTEK